MERKIKRSSINQCPMMYYLIFCYYYYSFSRIHLGMVVFVLNASIIVIVIIIDSLTYIKCNVVSVAAASSK
jgi:hypothetical protein